MLLANQMSAGQFDFQLRLDVTGNIYMLYKSVPLPIYEVNICDILFLIFSISLRC